MLLDDLLKFIPSDTEERVRRTRERSNQNVREVLRQETGLRLRRPPRDVEQSDSFGMAPNQSVVPDQITVRVELVPGLPESLKERAISDKGRIAALIAPWRDSLEHLRASAEDVHQLVRLLSSDSAGKALVTNGSDQIQPVVGLAERLLQEAAVFNLAKWILEVNEDVLGSYRYFLPDPNRPFERRRQDPWIDLYWAVIGLFARFLVVEIEDLTVVVLAHELAHAYTHLGTDIDSHAWKATEFAESDNPLKECLAQFCGRVVCHRLAVGAPKATSAFERVLEEQPSDYRTHVSWDDYKPEELRLALLQVRRSGAGRLSHFGGLLEEARKSLRSNGDIR